MIYSWEHGSNSTKEGEARTAQAQGQPVLLYSEILSKNKEMYSCNTLAGSLLNDWLSPGLLMIMPCIYKGIIFFTCHDYNMSCKRTVGNTYQGIYKEALDDD